jgi:hypothetical protein
MQRSFVLRHLGTFKFGNITVRALRGISHYGIVRRVYSISLLLPTLRLELSKVMATAFSTRNQPSVCV